MRAPIRFSLRLAAIAAALATPAHAATSTSTIVASATVAPSCAVLTPVVAMDFGVIDPTAAGSVTSRPRVTVRCSQGARPSITADNGSHAAGTQKRLRQTSGADTLNYRIQRATGRTFANCPNSTTGGAELNATPWSIARLWLLSGGSRDVALCGRLNLPQASAGAGLYTDTVTLTFSF